MYHRDLRLEDPIARESVTSSWVGALFALGQRLADAEMSDQNHQLVIAISVPNRDAVAVLIGAGWTLTRPPKAEIVHPEIAARNAEVGRIYRLVSSGLVIRGRFLGFDETKAVPRIRLGSSEWAMYNVDALTLAEQDSLDEVRMPKPGLTNIGYFSHADINWEWRLAAPSQDLALIGTKSALLEDMNLTLSDGIDYGFGLKADPLRTILGPEEPKASTWFTRLYSTHGLREALPLPSQVRLTVLDGQGAIRYLNEILAPIVVCIVDRSINDESAAEQIVQLRNTRGVPFSLIDDIGWMGHDGIEAAAFKVKI
jgi:hypothetical protein